MLKRSRKSPRRRRALPPRTIMLWVVVTHCVYLHTYLCIHTHARIIIIVCITTSVRPSSNAVSQIRVIKKTRARGLRKTQSAVTLIDM